MDRRVDIESGKRIAARAGRRTSLAITNAQWKKIPLSGDECMFIVDAYGFRVPQVIAFLETLGIDYDEESFLSVLDKHDKRAPSIKALVNHEEV